MARYGVPVGYSGHEAELAPSIAAVALGACVVERHLTLDRSLWGSDQAALLLPKELAGIIDDSRLVERACGDGRVSMYDSERPVRNKLRRVG